MIRITGGALKGQTIPSPRSQRVRPTSARVREALFSMLGQDLSGRSVLDGFAGTGLLSFEAISRGARPVVAVEKDPRQVAQIQAAAKRLGVELRVRTLDAKVALAENATWDIVFLDPPYAMPPQPWVDRAAPQTSEALVVETSGQASIVCPPGLVLDRDRRYGDTRLWVFRRPI